MDICRRPPREKPPALKIRPHAGYRSFAALNGGFQFSIGTYVLIPKTGRGRESGREAACRSARERSPKRGGEIISSCKTKNKKKFLLAKRKTR
jgi:hypothetical protein